MPTVSPDPGALRFRKGSDYVPPSYWYQSFTSIPGASNDETQGFSRGSTWWCFNSDVEYRQYLCVDATTGSAVWIVVGVTVSNTVPGNNDDYDNGFRLGSIWSCPGGGRIYQCTDDAPGSAVWTGH